MPVKGRAIILGGGTYFHVRPHLSLAAQAYGTTAKKLGLMLERLGWDTHVSLTRMAQPSSQIETNADVQRWVDSVVADPGQVIRFIEDHWGLTRSTDGVLV